MTAIRFAIGALGLAGIAYAAYGFVTDNGINPIGQLIFLGAVLITHDFVIVPVAVGAGALIAHFAPPWARNPARAALVITGAVSVFAFPFVLGKGRIFDNPSAFPQQYGVDLLLIIGVVWIVAAATAFIGRRGRLPKPASAGPTEMTAASAETKPAEGTAIAGATEAIGTKAPGRPVEATEAETTADATENVLATGAGEASETREATDPAEAAGTTTTDEPTTVPKPATPDE